MDVQSVAFSPDGKLLASGGLESDDIPAIRLWDVATLQRLGEPLGRGDKDNSVFSLAFDGESKILASGRKNGEVRLWDVSTRQQLGAPLAGQVGSVTKVAFSPNGKLLASAGTDKTISLWNLDPASWVEVLCRRANCNLSFSEWQQFIGADVPYERTCPNSPDGEPLFNPGNLAAPKPLK